MSDGNDYRPGSLDDLAHYVEQPNAETTADLYNLSALLDQMKNGTDIDRAAMLGSMRSLGQRILEAANANIDIPGEFLLSVADFLEMMDAMINDASPQDPMIDPGRMVSQGEMAMMSLDGKSLTLGEIAEAQDGKMAGPWPFPDRPNPRDLEKALQAQAWRGY